MRREFLTERAQNHAIKYMIAHAFMMMYFHFGIDTHEIRKIHALHIDRLRKQTFAKLEPVVSDVFADEVLNCVKEIIDIIDDLAESADGTIGCVF